MAGIVRSPTVKKAVIRLQRYYKYCIHVNFLIKLSLLKKAVE